MRKYIVFVSVLITFGSTGNSQEMGVMNPEAVKDTPSESVFVHYNSSLLFTGEYFYYKVYTLLDDSGELSPLSRVAYVEVADSSGKRVFRHKISLEQGMGQGDFFIPASVASGNYKILGYTSWNSNGGVETVFKADLVILNPYTNQQAGLLGPDVKPAADTLISAEERVVEVSSDAGPTDTNISAPGNEFLSLKADAQSYGKRERVLLELSSQTEAGIEGNYSLSVRKKVPVAIPVKANAVSQFLSRQKKVKIDFSEPFQGKLPELRGELFHGRLLPRESGGAVRVGGQDVALSIPGETFILRISRTNSAGEFFFNVEDINLEENAVLQVLGEDREQFEIELYTLPEIEYENLEFGNFQINPEMKDWIVARSVHNQVENGYFEVKPDTLAQKPADLPFFEDRGLVYQLDDYTRFKTLKETLVEIVQFLSIKKTSSGDEVLNVLPLNQAIVSNLRPMLIVDGVLMQNQGDLIHYPADLIKSLRVIRDKYYLGSQVFQGVVVVETVGGDYNTARYPDHIHNMELLRPQPQKNYFNQTYAAETPTERIPDFRYQLLWQPQVEISSQTESVEFFTSDLSGEFVISLEGYTRKGDPVSIEKTISVH